MTKVRVSGILCKLSDTGEHRTGTDKKVSKKVKKGLDKRKLVW